MSDRDYRDYGILEQEILDAEQELQRKPIVKAGSDIEHIPTQKQDYNVMSLDQTESAKDDKVHHFTKPSDSQHILLRKIFHKRKTNPYDNANETGNMENFISQDKTERMNVLMNQSEPKDINISVNKDEAEVISSSINKSESKNINTSMNRDKLEDMDASMNEDKLKDMNSWMEEDQFESVGLSMNKDRIEGMDSLMSEDNLEDIGLSMNQNGTGGTSKFLYQNENDDEVQQISHGSKIDISDMMYKDNDTDEVIYSNNEDDTDQVIYSDNEGNIDQAVYSNNENDTDQAVYSNNEGDTDQAIYSNNENDIDGSIDSQYNHNINEHIQHDTPKYTGEQACFDRSKNKNAEIKHTDLEHDMSFDNFVRKNPLQGRNSFMKWTIRILTVCVFLMLSPLIVIVLGGIGMVFAAVVITTLACIGLGLFILIASCFIATQISVSLLMLGIFISISLISFGGILGTIVIIFIKWCVGGLRKHRASRKSRHQREA